MEDTVQVMSSGRKIDRITRPLQLSGNTPTVVYRRRIWSVTGNCIQMDQEGEVPATAEDLHSDSWMQLVARLIPYPLPTDQGECAEQLRTNFRNHLPDGIVRAISLLTALGHETEARELLVDFLDELRSPERVRRLVKLLLLFRRPPAASDTTTIAPPETSTEEAVASPEAESDEDALLTLAWQPAQESRTPSIDDNSLRMGARSIQEAIGAHAMHESGHVIEGLDDMPDEQDWEVATTENALSERPTSEEDNLLLQRILSLGSTALDVLRYFADNPGDKAAHVEQVLGHSLPVVNGLLNGTLSQYLQRSASGGWACQSWVPDILAALDSDS